MSQQEALHQWGLTERKKMHPKGLLPSLTQSTEPLDTPHEYVSAPTQPKWNLNSISLWLLILITPGVATVAAKNQVLEVAQGWLKNKRIN